MAHASADDADAAKSGVSTSTAAPVAATTTTTDDGKSNNNIASTGHGGSLLSGLTNIFCKLTKKGNGSSNNKQDDSSSSSNDDTKTDDSGDSGDTDDKEIIKYYCEVPKRTNGVGVGLKVYYDSVTINEIENLYQESLKTANQMQSMVLKRGTLFGKKPNEYFIIIDNNADTMKQYSSDIPVIFQENKTTNTRRLVIREIVKESDIKKKDKKNKNKKEKQKNKDASLPLATNNNNNSNKDKIVKKHATGVSGIFVIGNGVYGGSGIEINHNISNNNKNTGSGSQYDEMDIINNPNDYRIEWHWDETSIAKANGQDYDKASWKKYDDLTIKQIENGYQIWNQYDIIKNNKEKKANNTVFLDSGPYFGEMPYAYMILFRDNNDIAQINIETQYERQIKRSVFKLNVKDEFEDDTYDVNEHFRQFFTPIDLKKFKEELAEHKKNGESFDCMVCCVDFEYEDLLDIKVGLNEIPNQDACLKPQASTDDTNVITTMATVATQNEEASNNPNSNDNDKESSEDIENEDTDTNDSDDNNNDNNNKNTAMDNKNNNNHNNNNNEESKTNDKKENSIETSKDSKENNNNNRNNNNKITTTVNDDELKENWYLGHLDKITNNSCISLNGCNHIFHAKCVSKWFYQSSTCPMCRVQYGILLGKQPNDGIMKCELIDDHCDGYEKDGIRTIEITWAFPPGFQTKRHNNPGMPYEGDRRTGYLPYNKIGILICKMFIIAFDRMLMFTIDTSLTRQTYGDNTEGIVWAGIHAKTKLSSKSSPHGYNKDIKENEKYFNNVIQELKDRKIEEKDTIDNIRYDWKKLGFDFLNSEWGDQVPTTNET